MQTTGAALVVSERRSIVRLRTPAQDGLSTHGLLYLAAVRGDWCQQEQRQVRLDVGLSAWELACHVSLTGPLQVSHHPRLSVTARRVPVLTPLSGT